MNTTKRNTFLLVAILSTLAALGVHAYLTQHYYALKFGAGAESVCNINEVLNCDAVAASKYSSVFGVPLAFWGLATNLVLLYFLLVTRFNMVQDRDKTSRYAVLLAGITLLGSVIMGAISTTMANICIFCVTAYVLSAISFAGAWFGTPDRSGAEFTEDIKDAFSTEKWVLGFLIAIPAIAFGGNLMYMETNGYSEIEKVSNERVAQWSHSPQQNFDINQGLVLKSSSTTPIMTIVEFADFRCPHCKFAAPGLHAFTKSHADVQFIFKPFPLDGTCNEAIKNGGDGVSCAIAAAVMCSEKIAQKGWQAHDYFFDQQEAILRGAKMEDHYKAAAEKVGIPEADLQVCMKAPETLEQIRNMAREGDTAKIRGTPTVFVNGKLLQNGQALPVLESVYRNLKSQQ